MSAPARGGGKTPGRITSRPSSKPEASAPSRIGSSKKRKGKVNGDDIDEYQNVKVSIRCRPMSEKEIGDGHESIVKFEGKKKIVVRSASPSPSDQLGTKSGERSNVSHVYEFDSVFDYNSSQADVYEEACRPIVDGVLRGYNGTILAYGQTGTGKTYTMEGFNENRLKLKSKLKRQVSSAEGESIKIESVAGDAEQSDGIIPRAFKQIFDHVSSRRDVQFLIRASYLEIYQEEIHDLLRKDRSVKLELHEQAEFGVYVKDLTWFVCKSIEEIERVMRVGNQNRIVGATDMNEHSSRSHAIFMITIEQQALRRPNLINSKETQAARQGVKNIESGVEQRVIKVGKLNLVDLAGSERQRKTNSFGQRQRESIKINLSLSALGNVINALMKINSKPLKGASKTDDLLEEGEQSNNIRKAGEFIPYRDSKLTRLLQDSLGGNSRTLMIANIGPASYNYDETINTLNYASRAKCIKNRPRLNEDPKDALLRELQREIDELRSKLAAINVDGRSSSVCIDGRPRQHSSEANQQDDQAKKVELEFRDLKRRLESLEEKLLNNNSGSLFENSNSLDRQQNLLEGYTREQKLELAKSRLELEKQNERERTIREQLEAGQEAAMMAEQSFSSIQQEIEAKKRLIGQILFKIKSMRDQFELGQRAYRLELEELDQLQYVLQKELKLKCLIMDNFVPNDHVDQILPRILYDDERNLCLMKPIDLPFNHCNLNSTASSLASTQTSANSCLQASGFERVRSEFEKISETIYPGNIRFKCDNLIEPSLEMPSEIFSSLNSENLSNNTETIDDASSCIQNLLETALNQREPDIVI